MAYNRAFLRDLKLICFFRERGECFYCSRALNLKNATFDHIIPKSHGGKLVYENVVIACFDCNHERGNMDAGEFLRLKMGNGPGVI